MKNLLPEKFKGNVDFSGDCWLWTASKTKKGYGQYYEYRKNIRAHRFSWTVFNGVIPEGMHVLHKCDVRHCVNPSHLFLGTNYENMQDMISKNRQKHAKNEFHSRTVLTREQVDEIRRTYQYGIKGEFSTTGLGKKYGVSCRHISSIVNYQKWVD